MQKGGKHSQSNLRKIFDDTTRTDPSALEVSFPEIESSMYRARRMLQPKIPVDASEFCDMLPGTNFGSYFQFSVVCGNQSAAIFFSDAMRTFLTEVTNVQFDGTFYTVPIQFCQLWTIFVAVGRHTLPAIHCLMTSKSQDLYRSILENLRIKAPDFHPSASMSDWEPAARNAFKQIYPDIKLYGCWFHFTQRIWLKTQKLGLSESFKSNPEVTKYIRQLMAIPFLPPPLLSPTFNFLQMPSLEIPEMLNLEKLKKYFRKRWLNQISPEELSIFDITISTNNSAESYHSKLKGIVKTSHPRIWTFLTTLKEIIEDVDNDIGRLRQGREITRARKKKDVKNEELRVISKVKLREGVYSPLQFLESICFTIGNIRAPDNLALSDTEYSDEEDNTHSNSDNCCVVCLSPRTRTWIFMPCKHANCCTDCSNTIEELGQPCPVCRSSIQSRFEIYTN